jgi:hypothetical protein
MPGIDVYDSSISGNGGDGSMSLSTDQTLRADVFYTCKSCAVNKIV